MTGIGWWGVPLAVLAGAIRLSTPFLFVSLGECITEKSGRINLGLGGLLVMGAVVGDAVSDRPGDPWAGRLAAGRAGLALAVRPGLGVRPRRRGWLVPVVVLSRELDGGPVERAGVDGGGAGHLRALGSPPLLLRRAPVRWRERAGPGAPVDRDQRRLLSVQRRAVRGDARDHDRDVLAAPDARGRPPRAYHPPLARPPPA